MWLCVDLAGCLYKVWLSRPQWRDMCVVGLIILILIIIMILWLVLRAWNVVRFTPSSSDFGFDLVNKLQTNRKHIILVTVKIQNPGLCALFLCDYNIPDYVTRRALQVGIGGIYTLFRIVMQQYNTIQYNTIKDSKKATGYSKDCLLYTSPSPRD